MDASGIPEQSRLDRLVGVNRNACGRFGVPVPRPRASGLRRTQSATDANRDPSRLTAAYPSSRKPLVCIQPRGPVLRVSSKPNCHGSPRWPCRRWRQPKFSTRSLAACRSPPSVQLNPKVLIHQTLSGSDRLPRSYGVMCAVAA